MRPASRDRLFCRSIFFVEFAVLLAVALCSGVLLSNFGKIDDMVMRVAEMTGEQRIQSVSRQMEERIEELREDLTPALSYVQAAAEGQSGLIPASIGGIQVLLEDEDGIVNAVVLKGEDGSLDFIGADAVGDELLDELERTFGLDVISILSYIEEADADGLSTFNFVDEDTGREGIVVVFPLGERWLLLRVHLYQPSDMSAASQYVEGSVVYYVDARGVVASGAGDSPFDDFDFAHLDEMPQTSFITIQGIRYIYTQNTLDQSGMRCVLFYKDPIGSARFSSAVALATQIVSICLMIALLVFLIGRRLLSPIRRLERENGEYRAAIKEKDGLLRRDSLLRAVYGGGPLPLGLGRSEGPLAPGEGFVVATVVDKGGELDECEELDALVRATFEEQGIMVSFAHCDGRFLLLMRFSRAESDLIEGHLEALRSALMDAFDIEGLRIYVSSAHFSSSEARLAYIEALESMQCSFDLMRDSEGEGRDGGVVLYSSLEPQVAHDAIRRRFDKLESQAEQALRALDLEGAADTCKDLGAFDFGRERSLFSQYRFVALKGRLCVAVYECESCCGITPQNLQDLAEGILACKDLAEVSFLLRGWAARLDDLREASSIEERRFDELVKAVESSWTDSQFSASRLARQHAITPSTVTRLFKKYRGCTFLDYLHGLRIGEVKRLLSQDSMTLDEISKKVGYGSAITLIRAFKRYEHMTPGEFRDRDRSGRAG